MDLTRRNVLAGLGAAALSGGVAAVAAPQSADADSGAGFDGSVDVTAQAAPVVANLTTGLSYLSIDPTSFQPLASSSGRAVNQITGVAITTGSGGLVAPLQLPVGATLREVTLAYSAPTAGPVLGVWRKPLTGPWVILRDPPAGVALPADPAATQVFTVALNDLVDGTSTYMVLVNSVTSTTGLVHGLLVGYVPPPQGSTGFVPVSPMRAYDSRKAGYAVTGPLLPNTDRIVSIKDAHDVNGGVVSADVVPVGATAIACNLTAARTTASNFLALTPGDATSYSASAINWVGAGVSIANGLIVGIDAARQVRIWNGSLAGSTDVIIDVTGYFVSL